MNRTEGKALLTPIVRFFISCCGVEPVEREGLLIRYIAQQRMNWPTKGARGKKRRPNCSPQPLSAPHALPRSSRMPLSLSMKIISGPTLTRLTDFERHGRPKLSLLGNRVCKRAQVLFTLWFPSYSKLREFAEFCTHPMLFLLIDSTLTAQLLAA